MKRGFLLLLALSLLLSGCSKPLSGQEPAAVTDAAETTPSESTLTTQGTTEIAPSEAVSEGTTVPSIDTTESDSEKKSTQSEPESTDFVRIIDYIPDARVSLAYATVDNFTGQSIYDFTDAYLRYGTLCKLVQAAAVLREQGYGIVVWDAYRPVWAQQALWDICPDPNYVSAPGTGTQSHCRGCAVDITLYDLESGGLLEMPTGFDDFTLLADRDYSDVPEAAGANARLLEDVLSQAGFQPYLGEWWHFTDTDIADYDIAQDVSPAA